MRVLPDMQMQVAPQQVEFRIETCEEPKNLETAVNTLLSKGEGWQLHGVVFEHDGKFFQSMLRIELRPIRMPKPQTAPDIVIPQAQILQR